MTAHPRFSSRDDTFGVFPPDTRFTFWISYSDDGAGPAEDPSVRLGLPEEPPSYPTTDVHVPAQAATAMYSSNPFASVGVGFGGGFPVMPSVKLPVAPSFVCQIDTVPLFHQRLRALSLVDLDQWGARVHVFRSCLVPGGPMPVPTWESFPTGAVIKIRFGDVTGVADLEKYWSLLAGSFMSCCVSREGLPFPAHVAGVSVGFHLDLRLWLWTIPSSCPDYVEIETRFAEFFREVFGEGTVFQTSFATIASCLAYKARLKRKTSSLELGWLAHPVQASEPLLSSHKTEQLSPPRSSSATLPAHMNPTQFQWRRVQGQYRTLSAAGAELAAASASSAPPFPASPVSHNHTFQHHVHQHYHSRMGSSGSVSSSSGVVSGQPDERAHVNYLAADGEEESEAQQEKLQPGTGTTDHKGHRTISSIDADLVALEELACTTGSNFPASSPSLGTTKDSVDMSTLRNGGHRTVPSIDVDSSDKGHKKTRRGTRAGKGRNSKKKQKSLSSDQHTEGSALGELQPKAEELPSGAHHYTSAAQRNDDADETGSVVEHEDADEAPEWKSDDNDSNDEASSSPRATSAGAQTPNKPGAHSRTVSAS